MMKLIGIFLAMQHVVHGYTASAPMAKPAVEIVDIAAATTQNSRWLRLPVYSPDVTTNPKEVEQASRVSYDIGLGKNRPVGKPRYLDAASADIYQASRFLNEHEATRQYPSPLTMPFNPLIEAEDTPNPQKDLQQRNKTVSPILPTRRSEDVVLIQPKASRPHQSLAFASKNTALLDPNTVWVEMLIHSEQTKHALAMKTQ